MKGVLHVPPEVLVHSVAAAFALFAKALLLLEDALGEHLI
jgi:hypothetical protein